MKQQRRHRELDLPTDDRELPLVIATKRWTAPSALQRCKAQCHTAEHHQAPHSASKREAGGAQREPESRSGGTTVAQRVSSTASSHVGHGPRWTQRFGTSAVMELEAASQSTEQATRQNVASLAQH